MFIYPSPQISTRYNIRTNSPAADYTRLHPPAPTTLPSSYRNPCPRLDLESDSIWQCHLGRTTHLLRVVFLVEVITKISWGIILFKSPTSFVSRRICMHGDSARIWIWEFFMGRHISDISHVFVCCTTIELRLRNKLYTVHIIFQYSGPRGSL